MRQCHKPLLQGEGVVQRAADFADVVVFNADSIRDKATFDHPKEYADGVDHVFVNGVQVLQDGRHTGARSPCRGSGC